MRSLLIAIAASTVAWACQIATSAVVWVCLLLVSAVVCVTVGVYILVGVGWMFICCGACLFAAAWLLRLGIHA